MSLGIECAVGTLRDARERLAAAEPDAVLSRQSLERQLMGELMQCEADLLVHSSLHSDLLSELHQRIYQRLILQVGIEIGIACKGSERILCKRLCMRAERKLLRAQARVLGILAELCALAELRAGTE